MPFVLDVMGGGNFIYRHLFSFVSCRSIAMAISFYSAMRLFHGSVPFLNFSVSNTFKVEKFHSLVLWKHHNPLAIEEYEVSV